MLQSIWTASVDIDSFLSNGGISKSMTTIHNALLVAICRGMVAQGIKPAVLEIGTYDGADSRILASLVTEARITTYDLPPYDTRILAHNPSASNVEVLKSI